MSLLAAIMIAVLFLAGQNSNPITVANANGATLTSARSSPNTNWVLPVVLTNYGGQDIGPLIAGSPLNGAAHIIWVRVDGDLGELISNSNQSLGGQYVEGQNIEQDGVSLIDVIGIAHDSTGRRHALTWRWPQGSNLCDY